MSIVNKIESISNHLTDAYNSLENIGVDLTNIDKNIENLSTQIESVYSDLPKVVDENTEITLSPTKKGKMELILKGNTSQDGTPTPDSPVNVNVVSGDNNIVVEGKNLLNNSKYNDGTYYSYSSGMIEYNQKDTRSASQISDSETITLQPGTYTIKIFHNTGYSHTIQFLTYSGNTISNKNGDTGTFTLTEETTMFIKPFVSLPNNAVLPFNFNIQIEKGSTASTYEPYQGKEFPLDLPVVNLFDKDNETYTNGYIRSSATTLTTSTYNRTLYIPCKPNTTYAIQKMVPKDSSKFMIASSVDVPEVGVNIYNVVDAGANSTYAIYTTSNNAKYLLVNYMQTNVTSTTVAEMLNSIQIEQGSKVNAYTPFGTNPIELCKIGNYQDYFYKNGSKWYLHKEIEKVVLNGDESWNYYTNTSKPVFWIDPTVGTKTFNYLQESGLICYCDSFQGKGQVSSIDDVYDLGNNVIAFRTSYKRLVIRDDSITSIGDFRAWLSSNNIILYYVLATPTDTEITDTTLINQLNALEQAMSYDNQTNISQENDNLPFIINATALMKNSD